MIHLRAVAGPFVANADGHFVSTIHLQCSPELPPGRHEEQIVIHTSDPLYRELRISTTIVKEAARRVSANPAEVFLIEGHTDAVGADVDNLSLSDRRAESAALALTQRFGIPAENLTTQGYGEQYLKIPTQAPERANRRVTVRRITPLLTGQNQGTQIR